MGTKSFNIFVGAETGLLKGINITEKSWCNVNTVETVDRQREIKVLCWNDLQQSQVCFGQRNQIVNVYDIDSGQVTESHDLHSGEGTLVGLATFDGSFVTCTNSGVLKVWRDEDSVVEIDAGDALCCMRQNQQKRNVIATGGKENDLKIWDLEKSEQPIFTAKNVRNDWLDLRVPVWVSDMSFIPNAHTVVTCTRHHQVRVYDPSTPQRRPVLDMNFTDQPLTALAVTSAGNQVIVGSGQGYMALLDLRGKGHLVQAYKGFAGGISGIQCHPTHDLVASCGLDRFVRVHNITSKELVYKFYLKSRLNCLLFSDKDLSKPEPKAIKRSKKQEREETTIDLESDDEELWANMELVKTKKSSKRKSSSNNTESEEKKLKKKLKKEKKSKKEGQEAASYEDHKKGTRRKRNKES